MLSGQERQSKEPAKAFTTCAHCSHCSSSGDKQAPIPEKAVIIFTQEDDGCGNGFRFAGCSSNSERSFAATDTGMGLLVDMGASETTFDNRLIHRGHIRDLKYRSVPKIVEVARECHIQGTATGIMHCAIKDKNGHLLPVRMQGLIVPGLGRNIVSPGPPSSREDSGALPKKRLRISRLGTQ